MNNDEIHKNDLEPEIKSLVPTSAAYITAFSVLFLSGIAGGLIGFAMMKVFFPGISSLGRSIGTIIICAAIVYGVSVITSLGLEASVEWKSRKSIGPDKSRPSRMIRSNDRN